MGIISWIVFGLLAGILAKFVMPGDDGGGFIKTTLLGVAGAMVGGFVGTQLGFGDVTGFNVRSFAIAIAGAVAVLWVYRRLKKSLARLSRCTASRPSTIIQISKTSKSDASAVSAALPSARNC